MRALTDLPPKNVYADQYNIPVVRKRLRRLCCPDMFHLHF